MSEIRLTGKLLSQLFFSEKHRDKEGKYICDACNAHVAQNGCGYSNLCGHINRHHEREVEKREEKRKQGVSQRFQSLTYPSKTKSVHSWMECVILGPQPFCFVHNPIFRKHFKQESVSRNTLMKYMNILMKIVEKKISALIPDRFAIVFGGWASGSTHFVSVFATFPSSADCGYDRCLLAMSPMDNETSNSSHEHHEFLKYVLSVYNKGLSNVVALVGDNASTNRDFGRLVGPCFVGCHSHRFHLAVKNMLVQHEDLLSNVKDVMRRL